MFFFTINSRRCHKHRVHLLTGATSSTYWDLFNGVFMKKLSSNFLRTTRLAYLALAAVAGSQAVHAQVNDSTLTITGTVVTTSCYLKIQAGTGASGGGSGALTASIATPQVQSTANTTLAVAGAVLSPVVQFTVGLASASGGSSTCTGPASWNTTFATASPITSVSGRQFLPATGLGTGAAMELYSYSADGLTQRQAIATYPSSGSTVTYSGSTNVSGQTGLASVATTATQTFGVAMVKTASANTALGAGTIIGIVTVGYVLF
jgi:hypothetical protein